MKTGNFLLFLLGFLVLRAIVGGGLLIRSTFGKLLGTPLSMLETSPFNSLSIPGILLFYVIGVAPCLLMIALLKKPESALAEYFNFFNDMH